MPTPPPHDALFKAAFGQPDLARSELELVLPVEIQAHLDLATLDVVPGSFVDEDLRHAHTDLLYRVGTRTDGDALVYLLMEHQSTFDARMPLRLLRYMVRVWDRWERDHPTGKLPVVLPVVLHHDRDGWRAAPEFASILDASPDLRPWGRSSRSSGSCWTIWRLCRSRHFPRASSTPWRCWWSWHSGPRARSDAFEMPRRGWVPSSPSCRPMRERARC